MTFLNRLWFNRVRFIVERIGVILSILKSWQSINLITRIVIGLVIGAILGLTIPENTVVPLFGQLFVGLLKGIAPLLVFVLITAALSNSGEHIGGRFTTVTILYLLGTFLAACVAVILSSFVTVNIALTAAVDNAPPSGIGEVLTTILLNMVQNPVAALMNGNYIGILTWGIILGLGFKHLGSPNTKTMISESSSAVAKVVAWIIQIAPFGIMGLVFSAVSENGLSIFAQYGKLIAILVGCMFFMALIINPLITFLFIKKNPYPLVFRCLRESGVTAFFTRSSAANIPVNMNLCRNLKLDEDFYSVSIPLGATINMEGAAITITVMTMAVADTLGVAIDLPSAIMLSALAALGACGASGVAGGSLLLIPMACSLFGISDSIAMQAVGVGFIIGVIQDSCETALNSSTDVLFTAISEYREELAKGKQIEL